MLKKIGPSIAASAMVGLCVFHAFDPILGVELCKKVTKLDMEPLLEEPWAKRSPMYPILKALNEKGAQIYDEKVMDCQPSDVRFKRTGDAIWAKTYDQDITMGIHTNDLENMKLFLDKINRLRKPEEIVVIVDSGLISIMKHESRKLAEMRIRNLNGNEYVINLPRADYVPSGFKFVCDGFGNCRAVEEKDLVAKK